MGKTENYKLSKKFNPSFGCDTRHAVHLTTVDKEQSRLFRKQLEQELLLGEHESDESEKLNILELLEEG